MFTDRFLKVPSKIYNSKEQELTGNTQGETAFINLLPMEISHYYKSKDEDEPGVPCTQLCLKSQEMIMVYLPIHEFEKLLNEHQK